MFKQLAKIMEIGNRQLLFVKRLTVDLIILFYNQDAPMYIVIELN